MANNQMCGNCANGINMHKEALKSICYENVTRTKVQNKELLVENYF